MIYNRFTSIDLAKLGKINARVWILLDVLRHSWIRLDVLEFDREFSWNLLPSPSYPPQDLRFGPENRRDSKKVTQKNKRSYTGS